MSDSTRRTFAAGIAAGSAASAWSSQLVQGANDRVRVGLIGCGGRGRGLWRTFLRKSGVEPVAACDVYEPFLNRAIAATQGKAMPFRDFRHLLDRKDIDAVIVASPDHWHALHTVMACRADKDVYVEKPLCLMPREGRAMVTAARRYNRVVQVGSQQRSGAHYARAIELIRGGAIGGVHHITTHWARNMMPGFRPVEIGPTLPATLDWDLWLGPAPKVAFDPFRCIYNYRWFRSYSGGQMTNWGAHSLDIARWALGAQAPDAVASFGGRFVFNDGGETPDVQHTIYSFPGCVVSWVSREASAGNTTLLDFHGTKGTMTLTREGFSVAPEIWTGAGANGKDPAMAPLRESGGDLDSRHIDNFLASVKNRQRPNADIEEGHRTAVMCQLGNAAMRTGRVLRWDPEAEAVIGDAEANAALQWDYRKPWTLAE